MVVVSLLLVLFLLLLLLLVEEGGTIQLSPPPPNSAASKRRPMESCRKCVLPSSLPILEEDDGNNVDVDGNDLSDKVEGDERDVGTGTTTLGSCSVVLLGVGIILEEGDTIDNNGNGKGTDDWIQCLE